MVAGWRECFAFPDLAIPQIVAKLDTGARTSALHALRIRHFNNDGEIWVRFDVHPHQRESRTTIHCEAPLFDEREVRSSNGEVEIRPVIKTHIGFNGVLWLIELTLTNRQQMGFRMLLGRQGMKRRILVDSGRSFLHGKPEAQDRPSEDL